MMIKKAVGKIAQNLLVRRSARTPKKRLMFLPHYWMALNDKYSIMNWRSDNALTLAHFILDHDLHADKIITIGISSGDDVKELQRYVKSRFPRRKVEFVRFFVGLTASQKWTFYKMLTECSHVFTSITYPLRPFSESHAVTFVDLGYFPMPFKNDLFTKNDPLYMALDRYNEKDMDYYVCNSELAARLILPTMGLSYDRYLNLGNCRNDYLLSDEYPSDVRARLTASAGYEVKRIVLYTPTHRDYESDLSNQAARQLLGYDMDLRQFGRILEDNGVMVVCKLHPKQNRDVIKRELPRSIAIHEPAAAYGLSELMKASDALLTDYTSGYFDYLLLDKPVVFNFYDVDRYKNSRGFTFTPIESICAGEIVKDASSMAEALLRLDENKRDYAPMRKFVRDLCFTYLDTGSTLRIYRRFLD